MNDSIQKFNPNHDERGRFSTGPGKGAVAYPEGGQATWALWERDGLNQYSSQEDSAAAHRVADMEIANSMTLTPEVITGAYDVIGLTPEDRADRVKDWQEYADGWKSSPDWSDADHVYIALGGRSGRIPTLTNDTVQPPDSIEVTDDMGAAYDRFTAFQAANKMSTNWNASSNDYGTSTDLQGTLKSAGLTRQDPYMDNFDYGIELDDYTGYEAFLGEYAKATYAHTQKLLKDRGVAGVVAYRGLDLSKSEQWAYGESPESPHDILPNALNSFSTDVTAAKTFVADTGGDGGWVLRAEIPADRIFSIGGYGPGATVENEITVLGPDSWQKPTLYQYGTGATLSESGNMELGLGDEWEAGILKARTPRKTLGGIGKRKPEPVEKFNPNHDERGRFSSGPSGSGAHGLQINTGAPDAASQAVVDAAAMAAFGAIAKVHKFSRVTKVDVQARTIDYLRAAKVPVHTEGWYGPKEPGVMNVSQLAVEPAATLVHEFGHMLDFEEFGLGRAMASHTDLAFEPVARAIIETNAFQAISSPEAMMETVLLNGLPPGHVQMRAYLAHPPEVFARAYFQWIATKTQEPSLMASLNESRDNNPFEQWADDEFAPISTALDSYFESRGLMSGAEPWKVATDGTVTKYNQNHDAKGRFSRVPHGSKNAEVAPRIGASSKPHSEVVKPGPRDGWEPGYKGTVTRTTTRATYTTPTGSKLRMNLESDVRPFTDGDMAERRIARVTIGEKAYEPFDSTLSGYRGELTAEARGAIDWSGEDGVPLAPSAYEVTWIETSLDNQRQGVATAMLEFARRDLALPVEHSKHLSDAGEAFVTMVKFNPNHDARGRFTTGPSAGGRRTIGIDEDAGVEFKQHAMTTQDHIAADLEIARIMARDPRVVKALGEPEGASARDVVGAKMGADKKSVYISWDPDYGAVANESPVPLPSKVKVDVPDEAWVYGDVDNEGYEALVGKVDEAIATARLSERVADMSRSWNADANGLGAMFVQDAAKRVFGKGHDIPGVGAVGAYAQQRKLRDVSADDILAEAYVKATYARTQSILKDRGIGALVAYRGVTLQDDPDGMDNEGIMVNLKDRPLSSWSARQSVALSFAGYSPSNGYILTETVPAEDIFSIGGMGPGAASEQEFIVIANDQESLLQYASPSQNQGN